MNVENCSRLRKFECSFARLYFVHSNRSVSSLSRHLHLNLILRVTQNMIIFDNRAQTIILSPSHPSHSHTIHIHPLKGSHQDKTQRWEKQTTQDIRAGPSSQFLVPRIYLHILWHSFQYLIFWCDVRCETLFLIHSCVWNTKQKYKTRTAVQSQYNTGDNLRESSQVKYCNMSDRLLTAPAFGVGLCFWPCWLVVHDYACHLQQHMNNFGVLIQYRGICTFCWTNTTTVAFRPVILM